jgi:DNA repair protein RadD
MDARARSQGAHAGRALKPSNRILECSQCQAIRTAGEPCRHCGFMPRRRPDYVQVREGELEHVGRAGKQSPNNYSSEQKREFYLGLKHLAIERGNKPGAAAHRYKDRFGEFPPYHWNNFPTTLPSAEVLAWDRHCRIKFAKAMQKAVAHG